MANTNLKYTPSSTSNRIKWTWSAWVKLSKVGADQNLFTAYDSSSSYTEIQIGDTGVFSFTNKGGGKLETNRKFRDVNSWYNFVVVWDSGNSTAGNRMRLYVNGVEETSFATDTNPSSGTTSIMNFASRPFYIGSWGQSSKYFDGSMSHIHFADGQAYAPTVFGSTDSTTGAWKINTSPSVTYGTNGFFLLKNDNSVTDRSGEGNNFTVDTGSITPTEDCPDNVFCTLNPLYQGDPARELVYSNGNGTIKGSASNWQPSGSTLAVPPKTGKWYWEFSQFVSTQMFMGIMAEDSNIDQNLPYQAAGLITYFYAGRLTVDASETESYFTAISAQTDVIGVALDMTAGTYGQVQFYRNGSATGSPVALTNNFANRFVMPFAMVNGSSRKISINAGNGYFGSTAVSSAGTNASGVGIFEHNVPSGFTAISTKGFNI